jgi:hypothetical protein
VAAGTPLHEVCAELTGLGAQVEAVEDDLATKHGVDRLCDAIGDRPVSALLANAGHGLGKAFLDQDFADIEHVIGTNITGTIYLAQRVGNQMRARNDGRILFTGSIAVAGLKNKLQVAIAGITPAEVLAEQHRKMAEPARASSERATIAQWQRDARAALIFPYTAATYRRGSPRGWPDSAE